MNPLPPVTTTLAIGTPLVIRSRLVMHPVLGVHPLPPCLKRSADRCAARSSLPQRATAPTDTSRTPVACEAAPRTLPPRGTPPSDPSGALSAPCGLAAPGARRYSRITCTPCL